MNKNNLFAVGEPVPVDLDAEIVEALKFTRLPTVEHRSADDIGRMSAEAVLAQYEVAAKAVEEMGHVVRDMVKKLGASMLECNADMKVVAETAQAIREKGKHTEALIAQASALSVAIRDTCTDFNKKVT